jgi:hypothetical protein
MRNCRRTLVCFGGIIKAYTYICSLGERLNDTSIKQAAWDIINANTTGVWPPQVTVSGTDVVNPVNEIPNVATNDSAGLSLAEYAVLGELQVPSSRVSFLKQIPAIAPELAPNTLQAVPETEWDRSTIATKEGSVAEKTVPGVDKKQKKRNVVKKLLCL